LTSSNQCETAGVIRSLRYFAATLQQYWIHALTILCDNTVTVFNLQRQGAGQPLLHLTRAIFRLLYALDIRLFVSHIPGKDNDFVDALSRMEVTGDYSLKSDVYRNALQMLQVQPTIDLFAHAQNYKCPRYAALPNLAQGLSKGAAVLDAFTIDWRREIPYIFPPVQILDRVLEESKTTG
jgi:hypothetical protein